MERERAYIRTGHKEASTIVQVREDRSFKNGKKIREALPSSTINPGVTQGSSQRGC